MAVAALPAGLDLSRWFQERVGHNGGRGKKVAIIALARKLLVAFWKYAVSGVATEGAVMTKARSTDPM